MNGKLTAEQVIDIAQKENPDVRFGVYRGGTGVGVFTKALNAWHPVFARTIDGGWRSVACNYKVNGQPVWKQEGWTEYKGKTEGDNDKATA